MDGWMGLTGTLKAKCRMGWMGWMGLSYTTVTPRASLMSDANNIKKRHIQKSEPCLLPGNKEQ